MKSIVIYHSWTGNTKQIAEAIHSGMKEISDECEIARLGEVDVAKLTDYDLVGLGSFVQSFQEPAIVKELIKSMPSLKGRYGFTFCTHGLCAGDYVANMVAALRSKGLTIIGWKDWYGGVLIPYMPKPYYTDGHPDEVDQREAREFGRDIMELGRRILKGETQIIPELPLKEEYEKLYGTSFLLQDIPEDIIKVRAEMGRIKPMLNIEKCKYPKCTICVDNCPTQSINPSESTPISHQTCQPCHLWFCEQLCPTGAIEVDWGPIERYQDSINDFFAQQAKDMEKFKDIRHFRSLLTVEEGQDEPLYKIKKHPRLVIRDGVVKLRS